MIQALQGSRYFYLTSATTVLQTVNQNSVLGISFPTQGAPFQPKMFCFQSRDQGQFAPGPWIGNRTFFCSDQGQFAPGPWIGNRTFLVEMAPPGLGNLYQVATEFWFTVWSTVVAEVR